MTTPSEADGLEREEDVSISKFGQIRCCLRIYFSISDFSANLTEVAKKDMMPEFETNEDRAVR